MAGFPLPNVELSTYYVQDMLLEAERVRLKPTGPSTLGACILVGGKGS